MIINQTIARLVDTDLQEIANLGAVTATNSAPWICVDHAPTPMDQVAIVLVDGVVTDLGVAGSNSNYEYRRISSTQTVIKKGALGSKLIEVVPGAIGTMKIGSTFKVA
jgi:hypothetical protein